MLMKIILIGGCIAFVVTGGSVLKNFMKDDIEREEKWKDFKR